MTTMAEPEIIKKRTDYIQWDDYFMGTAILASKRCDLNAHLQVGSCIVSLGKIVVGVGHHTLVKGMSKDNLQLTDDIADYLCHATMNAIVWANKHDICDCIIYTTNFPCHKCAQLIIQSGVRMVHYITENQCEGHLDSPYKNPPKTLLTEAGIPLRQYKPKTVVINYEKMDPTLFPYSSSSNN